MTPAEERFILAFNTLLDSGKIGLRGFCRDLGINHGNFTTFKGGDSNRHARVEWFSELCKYGVSAEWLLTGKGTMFKNQPTLFDTLK